MYRRQIPQKLLLSTCLVCTLILSATVASAQIRNVYLDGDPDNIVQKLDFYSPSEGYVAFKSWVGYTNDSGRTFVKKYINLNNVNYNSYPVNLTFGFGISGVHAFDKNNIIVYGNYGFNPSILYSTDGGDHFTLIYYAHYSTIELGAGVADMAFPGNVSTGYAVANDDVLVTNDKGHSWNILYTAEGSFFNHINAPDVNTVFAMSPIRIFKTLNGGANWQQLTLPSTQNGLYSYGYFLNKNTGWLSIYFDNNIPPGTEYLYKTADGGNTCAPVNSVDADPFVADRIKFTDENTGYAFSSLGLAKTINSGRTWEPLTTDINYNYNGNDMQFISASQFWLGGGHGFVAVSTNAGGATLPKAYFSVDTAGFAAIGNVNLVNYSRPDYTYKWFLNKQLISTSYNAAFQHDVNRKKDTIKLIVSNGLIRDSIVKYQEYYLPMVISSFTPTSAETNTTVTINGENFVDIQSVTFGSTPALSFSRFSETKIVATVGNGASGDVVVSNRSISAKLGGFTYIPPIVIDLPVTVSSGVVCKSGQAKIVIQNTQAGVKYILKDSLLSVVGSVTGSGGTDSFFTDVISRQGNYKMYATRPANGTYFGFTKPVFISVEHTKSVFTASRVNIVPGEKLTFRNQSIDAGTFSWVFNQDASTGKSTLPNVSNISYKTPGQKTLAIISTSINGCHDTLDAPAVYVYTSPSPADECYVQNIDDSDFDYYPESPAAMNKVVLDGDNGYFISGYGNKPILKSRYGVPKQLPNDGTAYFTKYTANGVLNWYMQIKNGGHFYATARDSAGNIYITGSCAVQRYLTFSNGDSIKISTTSNDTISYMDKVNGFVLKLDPNGNYLWHTVIEDPSPDYDGYPKQGGLPDRMKIQEGQVVVEGSFLSDLGYYRNGTHKRLFGLTKSTYPNDNQNNFVLKITENGSLVWSLYMQNDATNLYRDVTGIGVDHLQNTYITGYYEDAVSVHDAGNLHTFTYNGDNADAGSYLFKVDAAGHLVWKAHLTKYGISGLEVDKNGQCYISAGGEGEITNSDGTTITPVAGTAMLVKFDASGICEWGVGAKKPASGIISANSIYIKGGDVYLTTLPTIFNKPTYGVTLTSTNGNNIAARLSAADFAIIQYDTAGVAKNIAASGGNTNYFQPTPNALVIDSANNFIISGFEDWSSDYHQFKVFNNTFTGNGIDGFFVKTSPDFCASLLPVTMLNLTAEKIKDNALLNWKTATEINSSYFNIQRSINAADFITVAKVSAAGSSNAIRSYTYTDDIAAISNQTAVVYYRLQAVDKDGRSAYSNIAKINISNKSITLLASPNPVKNQLTIRLSNYTGKADFSIIDMAGHKLLQLNKYNDYANPVTINTAALAAGMYIVTVVINGNVLQQKFIKE